MATIKELAHSAAWQICEEIGMSKHSIERVEEIIAEKLTEQKDKACEWLSKQGYDWWEGYGLPFTIEDFKKAMEE